jgi:hypothetical protein
MSIGAPSTLGTLLVQRLDAALGVTLSQQSNIVSGARPDAVTQPGSPERADPVQNSMTRDPREGVDKARAQSEGRQQVGKGQLDPRAAALLAARGAANTTATGSAPTTLGPAARIILALLANHSGEATAVQGRSPLLRAAPGGLITGGNLQSGVAGTSGSGTSSQGTTAAGATPSSPAAAGTSAGPSVAATAAVSAGGATGSSAFVSIFAQALSQTVQTSGVFYESHLSALAFGETTVDKLMQEPQAQLGRGALAPGTSSTPGTPVAPGNAGTDARLPAAGSEAAPRGASESNLASAPARSADTMQILNTTQGQSSTGANAGAAAQTPTSSLPGLDPQTHTLVRQQLEVLANQSFAWRGEAWPNASMQWEVGREASPTDHDDQGGDGTDHWATRLTLNLPGLGEVQARLSLAGQQLVMHVVAPASAALLRENAEGLRSRLSSQGLRLSQLSIAEQDSPIKPEARSDTDTDLETP